MEDRSEDWNIKYYVVGTACSNNQLIQCFNDRYTYECLHDENDVLRVTTNRKHSLSNRQIKVFIVNSFDENIFDNLKEIENIHIISSELVLSSIEKNLDIPIPKKTRPLYCQHLKSAIIYFIGSTHRETYTKFSNFVYYLGGSIRKEYSEQVTHIISFANLGEKYLNIFHMKKNEILTENWLSECWKERNNRSFDPYKKTFLQTFRAKPLHNLGLLFFQFTDNTEEQHLFQLTRDNGGFITNDISNATHIIISDGTDISIFRSTYPLYKRKHRQYIVNVQWFWECLYSMGKVDESNYLIKLSDINEAIQLDSSRILLSTSLNDSNHHQTISVKRKRRNESDSDNENNSNDEYQTKIVNIKKDNKYLIEMEICDTEKNYVTMLSNIIRIFKTEMETDDHRNGPILTKVESTQIFGNIEDIYHLHLKIFEKIDQNINEDQCIASVFLAHTSELFRIYQPYTKYYDKTIQTINLLEKNNSRFYAYLKICERKSELCKQHLVDLMIRPIQRLPSILLLFERLLKYTPNTSSNYKQLIETIDKLRDITKKLNEERGKTEKHFSLFSIVNSIDKCPPELLAAHRDYLQKFHLIEITRELTGKRTHLIVFLFSDCIEITKSSRVHTWKSSVVKSYKHVALIQLSEIQSIFDMPSSNDENEQFAMICSLNGQARQLIFRVIDTHTNTNMSMSRTNLTDSITSVSNSNQINKTIVLNYLAKAIAEERCLFDKTSMIDNNESDNRILAPLSSIDFLPDNDTLSIHSNNGLNSVSCALKSGLNKAKNRLSRTFSFSPISTRNRLKKILTSNSSLLHLDEKSNDDNLNSTKRLSISSRQDSFTSEYNYRQTPSRMMHSIKEY